MKLKMQLKDVYQIDDRNLKKNQNLNLLEILDTTGCYHLKVKKKSPDSLSFRVKFLQTEKNFFLSYGYMADLKLLLVRKSIGKTDTMSILIEELNNRNHSIDIQFIPGNYIINLKELEKKKNIYDFYNIIKYRGYDITPGNWEELKIID